MRVFTIENCSVYIYDDDHPPPHCHVRFKGGEEIVVGLPLLNPWYGKALDRNTRGILEEHLEKLVEVWESKHE